MPSFENLVQGASIPELKEALRLFQARCPQSNDLAQLLFGTLDFDEKGSKEGLSKVVEGVCESFTECRIVVDELLNIDEDEFPRRSYILDGSQGEGSDSETEPTRKRGKRKRGGSLLSSPLKPAKQKKKKKKAQCAHDALLPQKVPGWWPDMSVVQSKSTASGSSTAMPPKRKQTVAEIFEADRQRRELEAQEEAERRRHEIEIQARCARCKAFFLTDNNWRNSCVFHPGAMRRYYPADTVGVARWFCCGRDRGDEGCRQRKHIDDRMPGMVERMRAMQVSAWKESRTVVYRSCEECETDVEGEYESEVEDSEQDDSIAGDDKHNSHEGDILIPSNEIPVRVEETRLLNENFFVPDRVGDSETVLEVSDAAGRKAISADIDLDGDIRPLDKESDVDDDDSSEGSDFKFPRPHEPDRFLCHACEEKAAAKRLQCTVCGDNFKALPSDDAYTAEKPICGRCEWANDSQDDMCCLECGNLFETSMRPHWYNHDDEDEICPACTRKMEEE